MPPLAKFVEAHSGQNYLIDTMLRLSNFKVFVVIFTFCSFNIILHTINFMLWKFNFIVQAIILSGMFNVMVPLINFVCS